MPERTDRIVEEELELLDSVNRTLAAAPEPEPPSESALVGELEGIREQLLRGEMDFFDRSALNTRWHDQRALLDQLRRSRETPRVDPATPYFAHLRLREGGRERDLCLGRATRLDGGLRIVDWRHAPIAQLFYRYQQGEDYEEEISGRVQAGTVVARRTVSIRDGELDRVDAPEGTFLRDGSAPGGWHRARRGTPKLSGGEGAALRVYAPAEASYRRLGTDRAGERQRVDKRLPDIAGLIDPAQFALITRPSSGLVVVRGAAGSGKTTVALHRIAYLAYADPEIASARTLFVVFSPALRDYVGHVLPALGVDGVQVRTFHEWAAAQRRRLLPRLPTAAREHIPALVQRLKLHPALMQALEEQILRCEGPARPAQVIDDWASTLTDARLLAEVFAKFAPDAFRESQIEEASSWCRARHEEIVAWMEGDHDAPAQLDPEDDALLLRAWQLRIGPLPGSGGGALRYRHVAIDEVQDFSPLEVRVLMDALDERRSLTLAGDTRQHVMQDAGFTSWSEFFRHLGVEGTEVDTLQVSYRSSAEITHFALSLLGDLHDDEPPPRTTRSGPPVELLQFTDHGACIAALTDALSELAADEPLASVALLTPDRETSDLYAGGLSRSEVPRVHQVRRQDFRFAPGIEVTEIEQVKGLEFDYVILVDASADHFPDEPKARRLLHVGATRAVHQLWVTCVGAPSPVVLRAVEGAASP